MTHLPYAHQSGNVGPSLTNGDAGRHRPTGRPVLHRIRCSTCQQQSHLLQIAARQVANEPANGLNPENGNSPNNCKSLTFPSKKRKQSPVMLNAS